MKSFGQLSLAAPIVGTGYGAWRRGYGTLVQVPANSATSTENELTASLDALRALLSVYPEIAIDVPALLMKLSYNPFEHSVRWGWSGINLSNLAFSNPIVPEIKAR